MEVAKKPSPIIKEPSKDELNKQLKTLDTEIEVLQKAKEKLIAKRRTKKSQPGSSGAFRDQLNNLIAEQKRLNKQKHGYIGEMKAEKQATTDL